MKLHVETPIRFESFITVECFDGKGNKIHEEHIPNLIVNNGWISLGDRKLGEQLLNTCILGWNGRAPALGDTVLGSPFQSFTTLYNPVCPDDPPGIACNMAPFRSMVARSTYNGGTADAYDLVDSGGETYWRLTKKRHFDYSYDYFRAGDGAAISGTCAVGESAWIIQGWTRLNMEAGFIAEVGFCSDAVEVYKFIRNCVTVPEWAAGSSHEGRLWNRVALATTIGFGTAKSPDVALPLDGVITVTMELRAHLSKTAQVQVMNINGESTTVTTRIQDLDDTATWQNGFLQKFGLWRTDRFSGLITEQNVMPVDPYDTFDYSGLDSDEVESERLSTSVSNLVQRYLVSASDGLWENGIGSLLHGNFSHAPVSGPLWVMATTFSPKIMKTNLEKVDIDVHYTWKENV